MARFGINPTRLRPKPTYESLVQVIANQPMIAYPDRNATMTARSIKMNQLFNENAAQLAEQQMRANQNKIVEATAQKQATTSQSTSTNVEANGSTMEAALFSPPQEQFESPAQPPPDKATQVPSPQVVDSETMTDMQGGKKNMC
jgi:hypothetical protein